jgi:hypothetical protein
VIFSRDRGSGRHAAEESRRSGRGASGERGASTSPNRRAAGRRAPHDEPTPTDALDTELDDSQLDDAELDDAAPDDDDFEDNEDYDVIETGPYDIADAPDGVERLDLGSLQIPVIDGVAVQVQANNEGVVQQIALTYEESALMLSVFAAPRGDEVWDEVRADIRKELTSGGARVTDIDGDYGPELRTRVDTPDGQVELRFVGVEGPRWVLRAIFQGRAAVDPAAAGPLLDCLRGLVVNRGREAMPALEALPLRLPKEIADQARAQAEANRPATNGMTPGPVADGRSLRPPNAR